MVQSSFPSRWLVCTVFVMQYIVGCLLLLWALSEESMFKKLWVTWNCTLRNKEKEPCILHLALDGSTWLWLLNYLFASHMVSPYLGNLVSVYNVFACFKRHHKSGILPCNICDAGSLTDFWDFTGHNQMTNSVSVFSSYSLTQNVGDWINIYVDK